MKTLLLLTGLFLPLKVLAETKCRLLKGKKLEGVYTFASLDKTQKNGAGFRLKFAAEADDKSSLVIDTDHAHAALKVGEKYQLTAEPQTLCDRTYVAHQIRLVIQTPEGPNPIWIRSSGKQAKIKEKLLKQHAPMSDFVVF